MKTLESFNLSVVLVKLVAVVLRSRLRSGSCLCSYHSKLKVVLLTWETLFLNYFAFFRLNPSSTIVGKLKLVILLAFVLTLQLLACWGTCSTLCGRCCLNSPEVRCSTGHQQEITHLKLLFKSYLFLNIFWVICCNNWIIQATLWAHQWKIRYLGE